MVTREWKIIFGDFGEDPPPPPPPTGDPAKIDGTGTVGQYLWAEGVEPVQWYRDGVAIAGATSRSYQVVEADDLKALTCIDASGVASNAIVGTWVRKLLDGTPAMLDLDRENDRYWHNGVRYTRAELKALPWVPDAFDALISATAWTTGTLPFPGYDSAAGAMIAEATLDDTGTDATLVSFSDNTISNRINTLARLGLSPEVTMTLVNTTGVTQGNPQSPGEGAVVAGERFTVAGKYKVNEIWHLDRLGNLTFDKVAPAMPVVDRVRFGANQIGAFLASGIIHRVTYFAGDVHLPDIEMLRGLDILTIAYGLTENDALEARDIFDDGFPAIVNARTIGPTTLYRQKQRGVFTPIVVSALADLVEVEGVAIVDYAGTGECAIFLSDQDPGKIYMIPRDGDYEHWGTRTLVQEGRWYIQDMIPIVFPGDDRESIVYTWEGTTSNQGGVNRLRWGGTAWMDSILKQRDGAYGLALDRFANGDLLYSSRNSGSNGSANPGVFRLTLAGVESTIVDTIHDWKQVSIGDFFGNGNEDVLANKGGASLAQTFHMFDAGNAWAETSVNIGRTLRYGCQNAGFKVNGRDAVFVSGDLPGYHQIWAWNGSAWALYRTLRKSGTPSKHDDRPARMNIFRQAPGRDLVWADSFGFKIRAIRLVP